MMGGVYYCLIGKQALGAEYKDKLCAVETVEPPDGAYPENLYKLMVLLATKRPPFEFDASGYPISPEPDGCINLSAYKDRKTNIASFINDDPQNWNGTQQSLIIAILAEDAGYRDIPEE